MDKLDMKSKDIVNENIEKISKLFPNVIVESEKGKSIDFELLKQELSKEIVEGNKEKYQLTWPGKKEAIVNANTPCNKTLRPLKEKSVDFENTKNIYIEGDNLEVLKIFQESYLNKIKCIYIDPPYNTGNDFIYKDNFFNNKNEELIKSGQNDDEGNKLIANAKVDGKYHSNWLSMIYPRLKLSKNLLRDDGVIFISIDNNEFSNLVKMCNEIFGEENFITVMPRKTVEHMRVLADYELQNLNDYVLVYCKNKFYINFNKKIIGEVKYEYEDEFGKYTLKAFQNSGANGTRTARPNLYYPIYYSKENKEFSLENKENYIEILPRKVGNDDGRWLWSKEKFLNDKKFLEYKNGTIYRKSYYNPEEDQTKYQAEKTWLDQFPNRLGAAELNKLGLKGEFSYSKPVELIKFLLKLIAEDKCIVLDYFSGSATTAQAVLELNEELNYHMNYIMVQLPEIIQDNDRFSNICEIGEERIKIISDRYKKIDRGLRIYKLDSSNMKDVYYMPNEIKQTQLEMFESNIKEDRTSEDLLTQVVLDLGLTLDLKIEEKTILKNKVYFVDENSLIACFDNEIDINIVDEICKCNPLKVVFKDESFRMDNDKINLQERFKKLSPSTEINII